MSFRILELFSGIGGMHTAFEYSQLDGTVVTAVDINTVANKVYAHNHPHTPVLTKNIQKLNPKDLEKMKINMLLMSPPCQPHTRVGKRQDVDDNRSQALSHLCADVIPQCGTSLEYVLMENVKGFESSQARNDYVNALTDSGFHWREFILTPSQFEVPNSRSRYYCIARKTTDFSFEGNKIWTNIPAANSDCDVDDIPTLESMLEETKYVSSEFYLSDKILSKRIWLMDIATACDNRTMCFTKAYTHYCEGTGSIYCPQTREEINQTFEKARQLRENSQFNVSAESECLELLKKLKLRYFTPREVARLMSFPDTFDFPSGITNRQKYRLLGNSINVKVVGELIKRMCF